MPKPSIKKESNKNKKMDGNIKGLEDAQDWVSIILREERFVIGEDNFDDLEINKARSGSPLYYFFDKRKNRLIKEFILNEMQRVDYLCKVTLIKTGSKFSPRLSFSVRNKSSKKVAKDIPLTTSKTLQVKANVDLSGCHEYFWKLIAFLQKMKDIEVPKESFSLITSSEKEIVSLLQNRKPGSLVSIIKGLITTDKKISLSEDDINQFLKRKDKLEVFKESLETQATNEPWWQKFFEENKWIFGYGLNYQILKQVQLQPNYGGTKVDGKGGQRGDYLTSTSGDLSFTVLVEIKTPNTKLLQGTSEIRSGAWSLSKDLTDALSQIQTNIDRWNKQGSTEIDNIDKLEKEGVFTVQPKGIIVIGKLSELDKDNRSKRETFQRFRSSIHGIDIITFDELLTRAEFIIKEKSFK